MTIVVVIPCFRVTLHVLDVIAAVGPEVQRIYCIDDACPDHSGDLIEMKCDDPRVTVLRHSINQGVGGAVMTGYRAAVADGATVIVKIDGDGQMDPAQLTRLVAPILRGEADYTKGNRFWDLTHIRRMPFIRRVGNLGLSFLAKLSSGYWDLCNDPPVSAQLKPLKHTPQRGFSCPALGADAGGCRTGSSRRLRGWRVAGFRNGGGGRTALSRCG